MTPDAVDALHEVAAAVRVTGERIDGMRDTLLAEQTESHELASRRFRLVWKLLGSMLCGAALTLLLLWNDARIRGASESLAQSQRRCSDVILTDALGRLSDLAVEPRYKTDANGRPALSAQGQLEPLAQQDMLAMLDRHQREVAAADARLRNITALCYGPDGPSPDPLH